MQTTDTPAEDSPGRGKNGRYIRDLDTAKKDTLAAQLRARGKSLREIANALGYVGESGASKAIARALASVPVQDVEELRALECARMDALEERLWGVLNTKYPLIVPGRDLVKNGEYVEDPKPVLTVIDRLLRIAERRAKLLGLDAPQKHEVAEPKQPALEPAAQLAELLRSLLAELPVESAQVPALLALPMAAEQSGEAA